MKTFDKNEEQSKKVENYYIYKHLELEIMDQTTV